MKTDSNLTLHVPGCTLRLVARLEQASRDLSEGLPDGPYLLEALLRDVQLCPSIGAGNGDGDLGRSLADARAAANVVRVCPEAGRAFAVERLDQAITTVREVLSRRVAEAAESGDRTKLFGARCETCAFA